MATISRPARTQAWIPGRKARAPELCGFRARLTPGVTNLEHLGNNVKEFYRKGRRGSQREWWPCSASLRTLRSPRFILIPGIAQHGGRLAKIGRASCRERGGKTA